MYTQDTIDAYVKGQLPPADQAAFEAELARDPELADAVAQARLDLEVANLLIRDEVRGWMSKWAEDDAWPELDQITPSSPPASPSPPSILSRRFYLWMAAAAALTLVLAAVWFFRPGEKADIPVISDYKDATKPKEIPPAVAQNPSEAQEPPASQPEAPAQKTPTLTPKTESRLIAMAVRDFQYRDTETFLRRDESANPARSLDSVSRAVEALRNQQTEEAVRLAAGVPASDIQYADAQLLLGQIFFEQKQYAKATRALQNAIRTGKIPKDQANWNLLMTLIAQYGTRKKEADTLLNSILADKEHSFYEDAVKLSAQLER